MAYFLHPSKTQALEITATALAKVEGVTIKQLRRGAYRPARRRNKVFLSSVQLLQGLIYCESEPVEISQEASAREGVAFLGVDNLLMRYVKHLVRISLWRNSFYVTLALCKFLYRYSTEEIIAIYDLLTQDPECRLDDQYCRARKSVLLKEIEARFGCLISRCRGPRGEEQLRCTEASRSEVDLVRRCLVRFTPWDTGCVIPGQLDLWEEEMPDLRLADQACGHEALIEVNRIHAVVHPDCFSRLIRALGLDPPEQRLAVPRFSLHPVE